MLKRALPAGFVVPAQPVERNRSPSGPEWVHEIKHDGYRLILRREDERVRLYSRQANDWTDRLPAIAVGRCGSRRRASHLTGRLSWSDPTGFLNSRRRGGAMLARSQYFSLSTLIEHDGVDLRGHP